jgi:hypothetical protein
MSDIVSKVLANLSRSTDQQTGAGDAARPLTREQDLAVKGKEVAERLDRLQGKLDAQADEGEDDASLPIRERFYRQLKNATKS